MTHFHIFLKIALTLPCNLGPGISELSSTQCQSKLWLKWIIGLTAGSALAPPCSLADQQCPNFALEEKAQEPLASLDITIDESNEPRSFIVIKHDLLPYKGQFNPLLYDAKHASTQSLLSMYNSDFLGYN